MVQRYEQYHGTVRSAMVQSPHGDFVRFEDFQHLHDALRDLSAAVYGRQRVLYIRDQDHYETMKKLEGRVQEVLK